MSSSTWTHLQSSRQHLPLSRRLCRGTWFHFFNHCILLSSCLIYMCFCMFYAFCGRWQQKRWSQSVLRRNLILIRYFPFFWVLTWKYHIFNFNTMSIKTSYMFNFSDFWRTISNNSSLHSGLLSRVFASTADPAMSLPQPRPPTDLRPNQEICSTNQPSQSQPSGHDDESGNNLHHTHQTDY